MADNYTALKSSQKKRYISKDTFNGLDLTQIPVGSEYDIVGPIDKGDLSVEINNSLNKAENALPKPTNDDTGSNGEVLVKTAIGSEWQAPAEEVYVGETAPTDKNTKIWIDPQPDERVIEYGIRWVVGQSNPVGERVRRIDGDIMVWDIEYTPNVGSVNTNPFDAIKLFNPDVVEDAFGNKFARFGKFYVAKETIGNYEYTWVCATKANPNYHIPKAFNDYDKSWDYVDIGIYEAAIETVNNVDYLISKTGQTVANNKSRTAFYNLARANNDRTGNDGSMYFITTMSEITEIIQPLFLIMCGTRNSQAIYNGVCSETQAEANLKKTGLTDTINATSGTASNDGKNSFKIFNIENWYGNIWKNVLDCTIKDYVPYVCTDLAGWTDTTTPESNSSFSKVGYTVYQTGAYSKAMGYDSAHPDIQLTTDGNASSSTYFCDSYWIASGARASFYGGRLVTDASNGLFCWYLVAYIGLSGWDAGARLSRRALASGG